MLPFAHLGHYVVWALYAVPVLIVLAAIVRGALIERRRPSGAPAPAEQPRASGPADEPDKLARRPPLP